MLKRWGLDLSVIAGILFALGIGGLNILYRWRVQPFLTTQLSIQDKNHKAYEEDTAFLKQAAARLGYNSNLNQNDASFDLNSRVFWSPAYGKGSRIGSKTPLVAKELKIEIAKKVFDTDDENLLSELDLLLSTNEKFVFEDLPKHVQEGIKRGAQQAEEGKLIPHDEVMKLYSKYLWVCQFFGVMKQKKHLTRFFGSFFMNLEKNLLKISKANE